MHGLPRLARKLSGFKSACYISEDTVEIGRVAQLGERGVRNAEVEGSNPFASTSFLDPSFCFVTARDRSFDLQSRFGPADRDIIRQKGTPCCALNVARKTRTGRNSVRGATLQRGSPVLPASMPRTMAENATNAGWILRSMRRCWSFKLRRPAIRHGSEKRGGMKLSGRSCFCRSPVGCRCSNT